MLGQDCLGRRSGAPPAPSNKAAALTAVGQVQRWNHDKKRAGRKDLEVSFLLRARLQKIAIETGVKAGVPAADDTICGENAI